MSAQTAEQLYHNGEWQAMFSTPLEAYFEAGHKRPPIPRLFITSLNRRYIGKWIIEDGRLYLSELSDVHPMFKSLYPESREIESGIKVSDVFPGAEGRVFAEWFSGQLRCPKGQLKESIHGGFLSVYERDLLIDIVAGCVVKEDTRTNTEGANQFDSTAFAAIDCSACGYEERLTLPNDLAWHRDLSFWPVWCGDCGEVSLSDYDKRPLRCAKCASEKVTMPGKNRKCRNHEDAPETFWGRLCAKILNYFDNLLTPGAPNAFGNIYKSKNIYRCPKCNKMEMRFKLPMYRERLD